MLKIDEARDQARDGDQADQGGSASHRAASGPAGFVQGRCRELVAASRRRQAIAQRARDQTQPRNVRLPALGRRDFIGIQRSDVTTLLDHIEDKNGSRMADVVLAYLRGIANWFAGRDDDYVSPFVRGMRRHQNGARSRILDDDELRAVWKAAEANGDFGALVRLLLLTGQRREKVATMRWADVVDGVWTIATAEREKGNAGALTLPAQALAIIEAQPRLATIRMCSPAVAVSAAAISRRASRRSTPSCRRCRAGRCTICADCARR